MSVTVRAPAPGGELEPPGAAAAATGGGSGGGRGAGGEGLVAAGEDRGPDRLDEGDRSRGGFRAGERIGGDEGLLAGLAKLAILMRPRPAIRFGKLHAFEIEGDMKDGGSVGVSGTPAFLIQTPTSAKLLVGAQPGAAFFQAIDAALAKK